MRVDETQSLALMVNQNNPNDRKIIHIPGTFDEKTNKIITKEEKTVSFAEILAYDQLKNFNKILDNKFISFKPLHSKDTKARLGNMFEADPYLKSQLRYLTRYKFGRKIKPRLVPIEIDDYSSRAKVDEAVDNIIGVRKRKDFMQFIAKVDELSRVYDHARRGDTVSTVYGTAAFWKSKAKKSLYLPHSQITIPTGTPIALKPINSFQLSYIHQDLDTMEAKLYQYDNPAVEIVKVSPEDKSYKKEIHELVYRKKLENRVGTVADPVMLDIDQLLIFDRDNPGVTPDTYYYGMSPLVSGLSISENLRRIDNKILPEINETQYRPIAIFSVKKDSNYDMATLAKELSVAGNNIVLNDSVEVTQLNINNNVASILQEKDDLIKNQLTLTGIPSPLFNQKEITTRSTLELVINIWQNTNLEDERKFLNDTMWYFWYRDLMSIFFKGEKYLDLELKVILEFENRKFTPFIDMAKPLLEMFTQNAISKKELRRVTDFAEFSEDEDDNTSKPSLAQQQIDMQKRQIDATIKNQEERLKLDRSKMKIDERMGLEREKTTRQMNNLQAKHPESFQQQGQLGNSAQQKGVNNKPNNTQANNKTTPNKQVNKPTDNKNK